MLKSAILALFNRASMRRFRRVFFNTLRARFRRRSPELVGRTFTELSAFFPDGEASSPVRNAPMKQDPMRGEVGDATQAPLPAELAFVVQLRAQPEPDGIRFAGRAEHMASGTAERFSSAADLVAFITKVVAGSRSPT